MRAVPYFLVVLIAAAGCDRRPAGVDGRGGAAASPRGLRTQTRTSRSFERFEAQQRAALAAQALQSKIREENGEGPIKPEGLHTIPLQAASQRRFAQIRWAARYPHGQSVQPRVEVGARTIRCSVDLSGAADAGGESDWTEFQTRIDDLEPGRYRIIAPLREVTLDVPN
jgi:hypothetical protein